MKRTAPATLIAGAALLLGGGYALADNVSTGTSGHEAAATASTRHAGEDARGRANEPGEDRRHNEAEHEQDAGDDRGRDHAEDGGHHHRHGGDDRGHDRGDDHGDNSGPGSDDSGHGGPGEG